jgi:ribonuclease HII
MKRAVENMQTKPDYALVDGNQNPRLDIPTTCIIKGDATSPSIAAASIIAKVTRDRLLIELDEKYPEYCFKKHKGYGTKLHYEKIIEHGILPVHRKSFLKTLDQHG